MKRLKRLLWIPLLFLCSTLWAADSCEPIQLARMNPYIAGAGVAAATTNYCNDANAVGCWYMNSAYGGDGSQTETDRTANGNDLAVSASDTIPSSDTVPSGYGGHSRDFETADIDYLTKADNASIEITGADAKLSFCAWIKVEDIANAQSRALAGKTTGATSKQWFVTTYGSASAGTFRVDFYISADGSNWVTASTTATNYAAGTWYHVSAVANDTDLRIYINGVLANEPLAHTTGIYADGTGPFNIGSIANGTYSFDGLIDEVILLSRELSSTEVVAIYNNGITGNKGGSD